MKLIVAIVRDDYAGDVMRALNETGLSVTRVSSTGGFWRRGNATLLVGLDEADVDRALEVIDRSAGPEIIPDPQQTDRPPRRATVFLMNVNQFAHY